MDYYNQATTNGVPLSVQILTSNEHDEVVIKGGLSSETENDLQEPLITSHKISGQSFPSRAVSFVQDKTFHDAVMNLCKAVLGATLMALPMAFYQLGWIVGASMYIIVAMLTFQTLVIIIEGAELTNTRSYSQLVQVLMGKFIGNILDIAQVLQIVGLLVLILLLVCDVLVGYNQDGLLHDWFQLEGSEWFTSRWFILGVICVVCLSPSLALRDLSSLSFMSSLGVFMVVGFTLCLGIITIIAYAQGRAFRPPMWPHQGKDSSDLFMNITSLIPVALLGEVCHQNLMPTLHHLSPYTIRRARNVTFSALGLATTIYIIASYFGVVVFGVNLKDDILTNLNVAGLENLLGKGGALTVVSFIKIGFLVNLIGSYLVNAWPVRQIVIDRLCGQYGHTKTAYYLTTYILLLIVYLISIAVKDVWKPVKLVGAICANLVAFIFPALVVLRLQPLKEKGNYGIGGCLSITFAVTILIIGVLSGITGVYSAFTQS